MTDGRPLGARTKAALGLGLALLGVGAAVGYWWSRLAPQWAVAPPAAVRTTTLTSSTATEVHPAFSPDGKAVAFSSDRTGTFEIFVRELGEGGQERQVTTDGAQNFEPAWSPDGRWIAYFSRQQGGIWRIPSTGGTPTRFSPLGSQPAWSPDGKAIAFQTYPLAELSEAGSNPLAPSVIQVASVGDGESRPLTRPGDPPGGHGSPAWSPDGKRIAFVGYDPASSKLWSMAVGGLAAVELVGGLRLCYEPTYSRDGRFVYFSAVSGRGQPGLWRVPVSSATGAAVGDPERLPDVGPGSVRYLDLSPDGRRLALDLLATDAGLWWIRVPGPGDTEEVEPSRLTRDTVRVARPAVSPDGRRVAYERRTPDGNRDIWVIEADGGNPRAITEGPAIDTTPAWLPDGQQVAFLSDRGGAVGLWSVPVTGGRESSLRTIGRDIDVPRLSPDGKRLAFNLRSEGVINVWVTSVEDAPLRRMTDDKEMMGFPCWSPDGQWLAIEVRRGDDQNISLMPSSGGEPVPLTTDRGLSWPFTWAPDGDRIAFAGMREGYWNVWWVSRSTGEQRRLTGYRKVNAYVRYPAWSPVGDRIVYEFAETTGKIWIREGL